MRKLSLLLVAILPITASADGLTYSYLEGGYTHASLTGLNGGGDGFGLDGSAKMGAYFLMDAGLQGNDWDTHQPYLAKLCAERDYTHVGLRMGLTDDVDGIAKLGIVQVRASSSNPGFASDLKDGYDVNLGLRAGLAYGFELEGTVGADHAELVYSAPHGSFPAGAFAADRAERYATVALRYHLASRFLLGLSYSSRSGDNGPGETAHLQSWYLAARWDFY